MTGTDGQTGTKQRAAVLQAVDARYDTPMCDNVRRGERCFRCQKRRFAPSRV
ncbi:MAG: hypothetical protein MI923_27755 [Phycisphaerales bacterium]|nr:hypothetical protein [Phycisphaerales bacterium]